MNQPTRLPFLDAINSLRPKSSPKTQLNRFKHLLTQPGRQTFLKVFGGLHVHLVKKMRILYTAMHLKFYFMAAVLAFFLFWFSSQKAII